MTLAYDIRTGQLLGQVTSARPGIYLGGGNPHTLDQPPSVRLLTRDGYRDVPASSVRLEKAA